MADKIAALQEAAATLTEAARDLRPKVLMAEVRKTDPVLLATMRSVLQTCETHASALEHLAAVTPEAFPTPEAYAARLERNATLNVTSIAMCERRTLKVRPELAAPLSRAVWTLNAAFSPT